MRVQVDFTQFSYGDAIDLEEAGFPLAKVQQIFAPSGNGTGVSVPIKLAVVLVWLFRRKGEPGLTLEQVKAEPIDGELEIELVGQSAGPKAAGKGSSRRSASAPDGRRRK